jgi:hypothetical protein
MTDQEFHNQYKPVEVPDSFVNASNVQEQVIFALAQVGKGKAVDVVKELKTLNTEQTNKEIIAETHQVLTELFDKGLIAGHDEDGSLVYSLQKITEANSGEVL